jgi:phosphoglycolate phosphatase
MAYRLVILDFDGTIADSFPWFLATLGAVAGRHGLRQIDRTEAEALRLHGTREILRRLRVPAWKLPAIIRDMRALKVAAAEEIPLFGGIPDVLRGLKQAGARTAIVSSDSEASIRRTLGSATAATIEAYACEAGLFGKAAKLRRVLRATGVALADAVYVGDETRDAEAAAKAGIDFAAVSWGYAAPAVLLAQNPAHLLAEPTDILRLVAR